ncbi:MAG: LPO_1073/Vpar_1526 family protein [Rhodospirillaceae bacterium]|nr:LPO_1073/Vpar_1526 family protein [Rhodospirillaceae bacterium]
MSAVTAIAAIFGSSLYFKFRFSRSHSESVIGAKGNIGRDVQIRDVTVTVNDTRALGVVVQSLFEKNFPNLQEDANAKARANVLAFIQDLTKDFVDEKNLFRFSEPDMQYALTQAALAAARTSEATRRRALVALIKRKADASPDDALDMIFSAAIDVSKNLSREHLRFIAFNCLVRSPDYLGLPMDKRGEFINSVFSEFKDVVISNRLSGYCVSLGIAERSPLRRGIESIVAEDFLIERGLSKLTVLGGDISPEMRLAVRTQLSIQQEIWHMIDRWNDSGCSQMHVSLLGRVVAFSYLEAIGKFQGDWNELI